MPAGQRAAVTPPPRSAPPVSLIAAARTNLGANPTIANDDGGRWERGIAFYAEPCGNAVTLDQCTPGAISYGEGDGRSEVAAEPFIIEAVTKCGSQELAENVRARAFQVLAAIEAKAVEYEFWTGAQALHNNYPNPYLAEVGLTTLNPAGTPAGLVQALAELQQYLADHGSTGATGDGGIGMIHAARRVVTQWESAGLVRSDPGSSVIRDVYGNLIVAGVGYPGTGPRQDAVWTTGTGIGATGGTYDLTIAWTTGWETVTVTITGITYSATTADLQTQIRAAHDGLSGVTVTGGNLDSGTATKFTFTGGTYTDTGSGLEPPVDGTDVTVTLDASNIIGTGQTISETTAGGPQADASNQTSWAYATDRVDVRLGAPSVNPPGLEGMTTTLAVENEIQFRAHRYALASFDTCRHAAIQIDLCGCCADLTPA